MKKLFGNSIAIAEFADQAETLSFESDIEVEVYGAESPIYPLEYYARTYPFVIKFDWGGEGDQVYLINDAQPSKLFCRSPGASKRRVRADLSYRNIYRPIAGR